MVDPKIDVNETFEHCGQQLGLQWHLPRCCGSEAKNWSILTHGYSVLPVEQREIYMQQTVMGWRVIFCKGVLDYMQKKCARSITFRGMVTKRPTEYPQPRTTPVSFDTLYSFRSMTMLNPITGEDPSLTSKTAFTGGAIMTPNPRSLGSQRIGSPPEAQGTLAGVSNFNCFSRAYDASLFGYSAPDATLAMPLGPAMTVPLGSSYPRATISGAGMADAMQMNVDYYDCIGPKDNSTKEESTVAAVSGLTALGQPYGAPPYSPTTPYGLHSPNSSRTPAAIHATGVLPVGTVPGQPLPAGPAAAYGHPMSHGVFGIGALGSHGTLGLVETSLSSPVFAAAPTAKRAPASYGSRRGLESELSSQPRAITDAQGITWIEFEYTRGRVNWLYRVRSDIETVDESKLTQSFRQDNCIYPKAMVPPEEYTGHRQRFESICNAIGWRLAYLNPEIRKRRGLIQRAVDSYRNTSQDVSTRSRRARRLARKLARRQR